MGEIRITVGFAPRVGNKIIFNVAGVIWIECIPVAVGRPVIILQNALEKDVQSEIFPSDVGVHAKGSSGRLVGDDLLITWIIERVVALVHDAVTVQVSIVNITRPPVRTNLGLVSSIVEFLLGLEN